MKWNYHKVEVINTFFHLLPCVTLNVSYDLEKMFKYGPFPFINIQLGDTISIESNLDLISYSCNHVKYRIRKSKINYNIKQITNMIRMH
jgi:hypothetical protein